MTEFYLWLSLGGILGGLFSGLAAPQIFPTIVEYPLVVVLACLLRLPPNAAEEGQPGERVVKGKKRVKAADAPRAAVPAPATLLGLSPRALDVVLPLALGLVTAGLVVAAELVGEKYDLIHFETLAIAFALPLVAASVRGGMP